MKFKCLNRRSRLGLALLAFTSPMALTAAADEARPVQLASMDDEITVAATRNPMPAFAYPGSVSVLTQEDIADTLASSVSDLFDSVPGVGFDGGPRRTGETPNIRGLEGEGVVILFDGVRQSFLSGHDGRFFIEPDLLKSAEIVRGPGSALYGSGAIGGVVAFETLSAADVLGTDEQAGFRVKSGYQDVNSEWMAGGTVFAKSADDRFDGIANLTYRQGGDIALGNGFDLQADDEIYSGLAKGHVQLTPGMGATATYIGYQGNATEPNNGQGASTGDIVDKTISSNTWLGHLDFTPGTGRFIDAKFIGYLNQVEVEEAETTTTRVITRDVETTGVSLENRTRLIDGETNALTLTYGGEYYRDDQVGRDNTTADGTRGGVPDAEATTTGLFVQAEFSAKTGMGDWVVIGGVRRDDFENSADGAAFETDDGATSPKIGVSYMPAPWLLVFGNYAEAFRAPSFNEIYADDLHFTIPVGPGVEAPNFFIPNPDLMPEESSTWEFGGGLNFTNLLSGGDELLIKGSVYESDVDNLIDLEVDFTFSPQCFVPAIPGPCTSGTSRNANVRNATLEGFELVLEYEHERFFYTAGYSGIDGTDDATGEHVGVLAPNQLDLNAGIKFPAQDMRLGVRGEFADDFDEVNDPASARDGYEVFDIYLVWTPSAPALEGLRFDLGVDNVADADYERVFAGVSEPGRNVKASVSWTQGF